MKKFNFLSVLLLVPALLSCSKDKGDVGLDLDVYRQLLCDAEWHVISGNRHYFVQRNYKYKNTTLIYYELSSLDYDYGSSSTYLYFESDGEYTIPTTYVSLVDFGFKLNDREGKWELKKDKLIFDDDTNLSFTYSFSADCDTLYLTRPVWTSDEDFEYIREDGGNYGDEIFEYAKEQAEDKVNSMILVKNE